MRRTKLRLFCLSVSKEPRRPSSMVVEKRESVGTLADFEPEAPMSYPMVRGYLAGGDDRPGSDLLALSSSGERGGVMGATYWRE